MTLCVCVAYRYRWPGGGRGLCNCGHGSALAGCGGGGRVRGRGGVCGLSLQSVSTLLSWTTGSHFMCIHYHRLEVSQVCQRLTCGRGCSVGGPCFVGLTWRIGTHLKAETQRGQSPRRISPAPSSSVHLCVVSPVEALRLQLWLRCWWSPFHGSHTVDWNTPGSRSTQRSVSMQDKPLPLPDSRGFTTRRVF